MAIVINRGLYGSSRVKLPIQAPDTPSSRRSNGPKQQTEAKSAATVDAKSVVTRKRFCVMSSITYSFVDFMLILIP